MKTAYWVKHLVGSLLFFSVLFFSAGKILYLQGWLYVAIGLVMILLNYTLLKIDAKLADERSKPGEGGKKWDKRILGLSFLATIAMFVVAGLDSGRYHWTPEIPWLVMAGGACLTAAGQLIFLVAQKQNRFFSSTVRIQSDRGHQVCDTGLYAFVRHPAYMGSLLQTMGFPLLFGSVWSLIPVLLAIVLLITRTALEDKTLYKELAGYETYCQKTRFRLIPLLW